MKCTSAGHFKASKNSAHLQCPWTACDFEQFLTQRYDETALLKHTLKDSDPEWRYTFTLLLTGEFDEKRSGAR